MTKQEFVNNYFGSYDEKAIYYLMKEFKLKYRVAKEYLDNIYFEIDTLKPYQTYLKENNLLIENKPFKNTISNIIVIGYTNLDPYIKKALENYNVAYLTKPVNNNHKPVVYSFNSQTEEITYVASQIREKLKTVSPNEIYLVNVNDDYKREIRRIFQFHNIPINLDQTKEIYGTKTTRTFLNTLKQTKDINKALESTPQNDIYNKIVDILNKFTFIKEIDKTLIEILTEELKQAKLKQPQIKEAINLRTLDDITEEGHYFILGFNQGLIPHVYHDDKLIKDKEREKLGLNTSLDNLKHEKEKIYNIIHSNKNITITYKQKDNYSTYYPSALIKEYSLETIENPEYKLVYSNIFNKINLSIALDKYVKYNEKTPNLNNLFANYKDIPYSTYNNEYHKPDKEDIKTYLNGKTSLSYSSMNNYFLCAYRFYIQNILKLSPYEEKFSATIGSLFHECLSKMYEPNFNLKEAYNNYQKEKTFTPKEKFFLDKLYNDIEFIIETIKKQEKNTSLDQTLTEKEITVDKSNSIKITFKGIIDKIKYKEEDGQTLLAIIDYKTGPLETKLDNINDGLHLQLPVYIYLTQKHLKNKVQIVGFYLQKILNSKTIDEDNPNQEKEKNLRLDGYTIADENLIEKFDKSYSSSQMIKGMGLTSKGFSQYAKLVTNDNIEKIIQITEEKIDEVAKAIEEGNFDINPKRLKDKVIGCEYCKFQDICYRKEEDIIDLKETKFKDIIGGENNA